MCTNPGMTSQASVPSGVDAGSSAPARPGAPLAPPETLASALSNDERIARLRAMVGASNPVVRPFTDAIRAVVFEKYDRYVLPLVQATWPSVLREPFGKKLRFLACNLYASAPYTVLFCAPKPPLPIALAVRAGDGLRLPSAALSRAGALAVRLLGRVSLEQEHRRIILISAFIAAIDHAFDHCMEGIAPLERERRIKGLLAGTWDPREEPDHEKRAPLALTRALQVAMADGITGVDELVFDAALARVIEWVESEVKGMTGVPDPRGLGHRLAGVEGTIDGLVFPVHAWAGEGARQWMYGVSMYTQMIDDWIDFEDDSRDIRTTPVITGAWTFEAIEEKWRETVAGIEALARDGGATGEPYVAFLRDAYVAMINEVMEAMIVGLAA